MYYIMEEMLTVRKVNKRVYTRFKARVSESRINLGTALTQAMEEWLRNKDKKNKKSLKKLMEFKPIDFGPGSEKISGRMDEIIYGGSK